VVLLWGEDQGDGVFPRKVKPGTGVGEMFCRVVEGLKRKH